MRDSSKFSIGHLDVDPVARRILAGDEDVRVEPKVFDLLLYMARHHGRAIGQDELLEQVWGRRVASDAVVSQAIHKLRVLLRSQAGLEDALVTLRGVGYRLDADITPREAGPSRLRSGQHLPRAVFLASLVLVTGLFVWWQAWKASSALPPPRRPAHDGERDGQ